MAAISKKDKLIEDAQKFAQRGQFDKAAKVYEQILVLEPASINLRQKLAELLIKCGRTDDARKELETVGKYFFKNGFFLKAVAVYKQLQKLFPTDISIAITLGELNEKLGLIANSLAEYKLVYEYHEKAGNIPEALAILDRMQNVDPQNIAIKIKLAEAYIQQGKNKESYSVFAKTASLLLERSDSSTLAKISARVLQLFPDKPDFMLEALTEQINQGNAASVITSIQNLLRSNPENKQVWELTILAYRQLGQPQRVKIAYQHYLKFFPSEPAAMLGLISCVTAERNFTGAVELLDQYEASIISAGFLEQLQQIYHALEKLEPINTRILQGLIKISTATGDMSEVDSLSAKLKSLHSVSNDQPSSAETAPEQPTVSVFEDTQMETSPDFATLPSSFTEPPDAFQQLDEEIEIDIDVDSPFASLDDGIDSASPSNNWLDSVSDLFDTISTAPRVVKFGNEMESSDAQSHFDLGQAFKEMGLFDEAINEFRQASHDSVRRVECLTMQCACLRERGEVEKAISMLQALLKPGLSVEESCAVKYELATGFEAAGKTDEAKALLSEINAANPGFRDISSRLNAANLSESLDFSDDDLKDF
jgi:tetratricopeptide (TPR) repeat protein